MTQELILSCSPGQTKSFSSRAFLSSPSQLQKHGLLRKHLLMSLSDSNPTFSSETQFNTHLGQLAFCYFYGLLYGFQWRNPCKSVFSLPAPLEFVSWWISKWFCQVNWVQKRAVADAKQKKNCMFRWIKRRIHRSSRSCASWWYTWVMSSTMATGPLFFKLHKVIEDISLNWKTNAQRSSYLSFCCGLW